MYYPQGYFDSFSKRMLSHTRKGEGEALIQEFKNVLSLNKEKSKTYTTRYMTLAIQKCHPNSCDSLTNILGIAARTKNADFLQKEILKATKKSANDRFLVKAISVLFCAGFPLVKETDIPKTRTGYAREFARTLHAHHDYTGQIISLELEPNVKDLLIRPAGKVFYGMTPPSKYLWFKKSV
jgi:hypothetical protein